MDKSQSRLPACLAYLPVIGWLYVIFFQRKDPFAMFHVRQSVGLVIYLAMVLLGWSIFAWLVSWIPFGMLFAVTVFTLVVIAFFAGLIVWVMGISNALQGRVVYLPFFGKMANQLPL